MSLPIGGSAENTGLSKAGVQHSTKQLAWILRSGFYLRHQHQATFQVELENGHYV
jgi:hypothetical protein